MKANDIVSIFRLKRWYQNLLVIFGSVLAIKLIHLSSTANLEKILLTVISVCLISSGNYGVNEILDAEQDKFHPQKRNRAIPAGRVKKTVVMRLVVGLYLLGFLLSWIAGSNKSLFFTLIFFLFALLYNVKPIRLKDRPYIDFTLEAMNSPLRFLIGWYAVTQYIFPASLVIALWFLGIFLMAAKRFGDIRFIKDKNLLESYRKSQKYYTEKSLLFSMLIAIGIFYYMLGALCMKYSIDLFFTLPLVIIWTLWFFHLAYEDDTIIKDPERFFEKPMFLLFSLSITGIFFYFLSNRSDILGYFKQWPY